MKEDFIEYRGRKRMSVSVMVVLEFVVERRPCMVSKNASREIPIQRRVGERNLGRYSCCRIVVQVTVLMRTLCRKT